MFLNYWFCSAQSIMTRKDAPEVDEQMSLYRLLQRRKVRFEYPAAAAWWACYDLLYIRTLLWYTLQQMHVKLDEWLEYSWYVWYGMCLSSAGGFCPSSDNHLGQMHLWWQSCDYSHFGEWQVGMLPSSESQWAQRSHEAVGEIIIFSKLPFIQRLTIPFHSSPRFGIITVKRSKRHWELSPIQAIYIHTT